MTEERLKELHGLCSNNKTSIQDSRRCGCFYCKKIFSAGKVTKYVGHNRSDALCPSCGVDAVLPSCDVSLSKEMLGDMYERWFSIRAAIKEKSI